MLRDNLIFVTNSKGGTYKVSSFFVIFTRLIIGGEQYDYIIFIINSSLHYWFDRSSSRRIISSSMAASIDINIGFDCRCPNIKKDIWKEGVLTRALVFAEEK